MKKVLTLAIAAIALSAIPLSGGTVMAEDLNEIFKRANDYVAAKNYPKAMEELGWATKELEKLHTQRLESYLPQQVAGYTGEKVEANSALGFLTLERTYKKAGSDAELHLSLTGGSASGGGLGGLAGLGRMAAMMGGPGQDTFRVQGKTATLTKNDDNSGELNIFLDSGSVLKIDGPNTDDLKKFADGLKLNELDAYLRGTA